MKRDLCELYSNIKSCNGENSCLMAIVFFFLAYGETVASPTNHIFLLPFPFSSMSTKILCDILRDDI